MEKQTKHSLKILRSFFPRVGTLEVDTGILEALTLETSKQGELKHGTSYNDLLEALGCPTINYYGKGGKVDVEWIIVTPHGVATIYNYKNGQNYTGEEGTPTQDIKEWTVGGHCREAFIDICEYIDQKQVEDRELPCHVCGTMIGIDVLDENAAYTYPENKPYCPNHDPNKNK